MSPDVGVLVLALRANDELRGVDVQTIEDNLARFIERAPSLQIAVLLCGMETPPFHGFDYSFRFHNLFWHLASAYNVPFVLFLLHPNRAGAEKVAGTVWPYLEPMLE